MRAETAICLIVFIWAEKSLLEKIEQAFCESLSLFSSAILQTKIELRSIWTGNLCNRVENLKKTCISAFWHSKQYSTRSQGDRVRMNICVFDIRFFFLWTLFVVTFFLLPCFLLLHDTWWLSMAGASCCAQIKAQIARLTQLGYIYLGSAPRVTLAQLSRLL